jgi:hypothetical protein
VDNIIEGTLCYDETQDRLCAMSDDREEHYFHCGEYLQIWFLDAWEDSWAELSESHGWYLAGYYQCNDIPDGLRVRFYE